MQHLAEHTQTTEPSPATVDTECVSNPTESGRRLAEAQTADLSWRLDLVRRLYRRIQWLRRFDRIVQYVGAGVGAGLLLAALAVLFGNAVIADDEAYGRLLMSLIAGAIATSVGGVGVVAVLAWCGGWSWNWIVRIGLEEEFQELERSNGPTMRAKVRFNADPVFTGIGWLLIFFVFSLFLWALLAAFAPN